MNSTIKKNTRYEILTEGGFKDFGGIKQTFRDDNVRIIFSDNSELQCTPEHKIKLVDNSFCYAKDLKIGDVTSSKLSVISLEYNVHGENTDYYDLLDVVDGHEYITNNVTSHNCAIINRNLWEEFYTAVLPTISRAPDSKMILCSTPKGRNHYFELWNSAVNGENGFKPFKSTWKDIPGRDEKWKQDEIKKMTGIHKEDKFRQEFNCEFLHAVSNAVITADALQKILTKLPTGKQFEDKFRIYEPPIPNYQYALCCDCATGIGEDDSVIQVIHTNPPKGHPFRQVAVYQCNTVDLTAFPYIIDKIHKQYNKGMILIENNAEAFSVVKDLVYEIGNEEVFNDGAEKGSFGGIKTTSKVKKKGVSAMKELIENVGIELVDAPTVNQLGTFIAKGAKYGAKTGFHDDLVSCLVTFSYFISMDIGKEMLERDALKDIHISQIKDIDESFISPIFSTSDGDDEAESIGGGFNWDDK